MAAGSQPESVLTDTDGDYDAGWHGSPWVEVLALDLCLSNISHSLDEYLGPLSLARLAATNWYLQSVFNIIAQDRHAAGESEADEPEQSSC